MSSFRLLVGIVLASPLAAAQSVDDSIQPASSPQFAGVLNLASGVLSLPNGTHHLVTPGVIYDNTCPTPNFSSLLSGNTVLDDGRLPSTSSPGPNTGSLNTYRVTSFQIGYCTRELDVTFGGPGATVDVSFWEDYDDCANLAFAGPPTASFQITGLPASATLGALSCYIITIDLTGGNEFHLKADANGAYDGLPALDGFGYGLAMPNQTGTTTATVGGFLIAGDLTPPGDCGAGAATYYNNPVAPNGTGLDNDNLFARDGTNPGQTLGCFFFGPPPAIHGGYYMRITGDLSDCNGNAEPDALDIALGVSNDCNGNDVPDECDIASGTSTDLNANSIPDDCEGAGSVAYCFGDGSGPACPCANTGATGHGCANSAGGGTRMFKVGSTSVLADDLEFYSVGAPPSEFGLYFLGLNQTASPFGDGLRCVGQIRLRYAVQQSSPAGVFHQPNVISLASFLAPVGSTRHFQNWHRDIAGPCGSGVNMSNGLSVTFTP